MKIGIILLISILFLFMSGCVEEESAVQQGAPGQAGKLWFKLWKDPSEGAFSILVPKGWGAEGGTKQLWTYRQE